MESTAPTKSKTEEIKDELSVRFYILDKLRGLKNGHGNLFVGVRPGPRTVSENIVKDMKQYFIIKKPNEIKNSLVIIDVEQLEKEYQVIEAAGQHINLIKKEEYHNKDNIVYMALDFAIAKSLFHYLTTMGVREGSANTLTRNNERWTRYLFRQFIAGL